LREIAKAGRQHACTFDTLIYPEPETSVSTSRTWSGLSSNDGGGSNLPPARSDSPDLIDGGPDGAGYSPKGHFRQAEMPDLWAFRAGSEARRDRPNRAD
jgi:hypothetical protein